LAEVKVNTGLAQQLSKVQNWDPYN